jgi:hypothetical protein
MAVAKKARRTKAEIEAICDGLHELVGKDNPITVRGAFYRAVSAGLVGKTQAEYKQTVQRLVLRMRRDGRMPHKWIADLTRWMRKPDTWSSLEDFQEYACTAYRRSVWDEQGAYVEIWCEKDALAGVLMEETAPWDVPLMVARGGCSETFLYEAAEHIKWLGKPAYLYYFGDWDPSGDKIEKAIERRLRQLAPRAKIHFKRVAVTRQQIRQWDLPTRPTKTKGNPHAADWEGGDSVEVDAIEPQRLRQLVRDCIERHVDMAAHERLLRVEAAERKSLEAILPFLNGMGKRRK